MHPGQANDKGVADLLQNGFPVLDVVNPNGGRIFYNITQCYQSTTSKNFEKLSIIDRQL